MNTELGQFEDEDKHGYLWWVKPALEKLILRDKTRINDFAEQIKKKHAKKLSEYCQAHSKSFEDSCLELAIKFYIRQHKTIDPAKEIEIQKWEIGQEKYFRELEGKIVTLEEVMRTWAVEHAAGWRDHNALRIIYVFEKEKSYFMSLLKTTQTAQ